MDTPRHSRPERLTIAKVSGLLKSRAAQDPDQWPTVAHDLREITADPHLLAHAWHPRAVERDEILRLAGADMDEVARRRAQPEGRSQLGGMAERIGGRHEAYRRGEGSGPGGRI